MRRPDRGLASRYEVVTTISREAMRRAAPTTRPSLLVDRDTPAAEYGIEVASLPFEPWRRLYMSPEDCGAVIAKSRRGKTQQIANPVIDVPGPAVVTSTGIDIYALTAPLRAGVGDLVVVNPHGLGGVRSTMRFDLLGPCTNAQEAGLRAGYLLAGGKAVDGVEDGKYWEGNAHLVLRCVLHAAAISGRDMRTAYRWAVDWSDTTPVDVLRRYKKAAPGWADELESAHAMDKGEGRTAKGIIGSLRLALAFMAHEETAALVLPASDGDGLTTFDPATFLASGRPTLYLLGADVEHSGIGPLFSVITASLFETGKRLASYNVDLRTGQMGRLDPFCFFCLDEAALICPVPLPRWLAEAGRNGMPILAAFQSVAQIEDVWGRLGRIAILDNLQMLVVHGGGNDVDILRNWSTLFGQHETRAASRTTHPEHGTGHTFHIEQQPTISVDRLHRLPKGRCVVKYGGGRPVMGAVRHAYKRRDVRAAAQRVGIPAAPAYDDTEHLGADVRDLAEYRKALT